MTQLPQDIVTAETEVDDDFWIHAAQKAVRKYCGWHIAPNIPVTGTLNSKGGRVIHLPALQVTELTTLEVDGADWLPFVRYGGDGLIESRDRPFPAGVAIISYRMVAGYGLEEIQDVASIIIQSARRAASTPAGRTKSQSVNGASVSFDITGGGAPAIDLLQEERRQLDAYKIGVMP